MCGRFACGLACDELEEVARTKTWVNESVVKATGETRGRDTYAPNHNVRPTTAVPVVRMLQEHPQQHEQQPQKVLQMMRWGLVSQWAKEVSNYPLINACSETVEVKPTFKQALKGGCTAIVIASAFYEWFHEPSATDEKKRKKTTPVQITSSESPVIRMAALYSTWTHPQSRAQLYSFTILTTSASTVIDWLHTRMPVLLDEQQADQWLRLTSEWQSCLTAKLCRNAFEFATMSDDLTEVVANGRPALSTSSSKRKTLEKFLQASAEGTPDSPSRRRKTAAPKSAFAQKKGNESGAEAKVEKRTDAKLNKKQKTLDVFFRSSEKPARTSS